jgi:hypothetical protein
MKTQEKTQKSIDFIEEIIAISKKYELSIGHEDQQGAFIIEPYSEGNSMWLRSAFEEELVAMHYKIEQNPNWEFNEPNGE